MVTMLKSRLTTQPLAIKTADLTVSATIRTRGGKWMRTRDRILTRDAGLCQPCKSTGRLTLASEVDHITRLADGGTDNDVNLQSICADCHKAKTKAEATATQTR